MEAVASLIAELVVEFILQVLLQGGVVNLDGVGNLASRVGRGVFKAIMYAELGILCGVASVYVWPYPAVGMIANVWISLLLLPLMATICTVKLSRCLQSNKGWTIGLSRFWLSLVLSLGFASVRYMYLTRVL